MENFPTNLLEATRYFADEQRCIDVVKYLRWPNGTPICPKCGKEENERKHYWLATQKRWKCYACRKQFSVKVNSIFEDSAISLDKWLIALWLLCNCKNGISSYEIARDLKMSQKAAWFVLQRLRAILPTESHHLFGFGGPVEGMRHTSDLIPSRCTRAVRPQCNRETAAAKVALLVRLPCKAS